MQVSFLSTHVSLHVLAEVIQWFYEIARQECLAHLRLLRKQTAGSMAGHGKGVIWLIPFLCALAEEAQQLWESFTSCSNETETTQTVGQKQTLVKQLMLARHELQANRLHKLWSCLLTLFLPIALCRFGFFIRFPTNATVFFCKMTLFEFKSGLITCRPFSFWTMIWLITLETCEEEKHSCCYMTCLMIKDTWVVSVHLQ